MTEALYHAAVALGTFMPVRVLIACLRVFLALLLEIVQGLRERFCR